MHLRDNFRSGLPITQVPASWFNSVAQFINNLVGGKDITVNKSLHGATVIEYTGDGMSKKVGEAEDKTDKGEDDVVGGGAWVWEAKGENGLKLDVYCRIEEDSGYHYFSRCRLTISKDGLIVKAEELDGQRLIEA